MAEIIKANVTSFVGAMKDFFGFKEGQTLTAFSAELKTLSEEERNFFREGLRESGYPNVV